MNSGVRLSLKYSYGFLVFSFELKEQANSEFWGHEFWGQAFLIGVVGG